MFRLKRPRSVPMSLAGILLLVGGCGPLPTNSDYAQPKNVFGMDDRTDITSTDQPYSALGRLPTGCTGAMVGRYLVLTAAHCTIVTGTGEVKEQLTYFDVNVIAGTARDRVWIEKIWYGTNNPDGQNSERGKDWAILKLDRPVGDTYGFMSVEEPNLSTLPLQTNLAGYSLDREGGGTASMHRGCSVREIVGDRLLHDCDAKAGISGAPMFRLNGTQATVSMISVSEYRNGASGSVDAPEYAREVANVAISATAFASTLAALRQSVDNDQPAPALPGVLSKTNPNVPDIDPPPPPPPPPDSDIVREQDLIVNAELRGHASAARRTATIALQSAELVYGVARSYNDMDAADSASGLMDAARALQTSLDSVSSSTTTAVRERIAAALTSAIRYRATLDARTQQCSPVRYCDELRPFMVNVNSSVASLRDQLVR